MKTKTPALVLMLLTLSGGQAVAALDANGDGKVSGVEFRVGRTAMIMGADADRDGRVSQAEFASASRIAYERAGRPGLGDGHRVFHAIDANRDGFLDEAECHVALDRRFKALDGDGDGVLSALEQAAWKRPGAS